MVALVWGITIGVFILFGISFYQNKARILNGFLFNLCVIMAGIVFFAYAAQTNNKIMLGILLVAALFFMFMVLFGIYILIAILFLNARIVFKRERKSLSNSLTLLLAIGLLGLLLVSTVINFFALPLWVEVPWSGLLFVLLYQGVHVLNFLSAHFLCNISYPPKKQQYIIVLGSGLVQGEVPPLLAARVDKAIEFYNKQKKKTKPPKIVLSGGQGADEPRSEAEAMAAYAVLKGIPRRDILLEDKSATTYENMKFSKAVIEEDCGQEKYRCLYSTSRYHLLRAGMYAKKAGLKAEGIGAKTALYYWPNAMLREYIAIQVHHRKRSLIINGFVFFVGAMLPLFPYLLDKLIEIMQKV